MTPTPLNGSKTHPLSAHARSELARIAKTPVPSQDVNPGVVNRLRRESLVELVQLPSPFASHKGRKIEHLQVSDAGRALLDGDGVRVGKPCNCSRQALTCDGLGRCTDGVEGSKP
jgi:hypothetical protein